MSSWTWGAQMKISAMFLFLPYFDFICNEQTHCDMKSIGHLISRSLVSLFQSKSKCETIFMKMTLICMKMRLHAELIFIWKGRAYIRFETEAQKNSEIAYLLNRLEAQLEMIEHVCLGCCFASAITASLSPYPCLFWQIKKFGLFMLYSKPN